MGPSLLVDTLALKRVLGAALLLKDEADEETSKRRTELKAAHLQYFGDAAAQKARYDARLLADKLETKAMVTNEKASQLEQSAVPLDAAIAAQRLARIALLRADADADAFASIAAKAAFAASEHERSAIHVSLYKPACEAADLAAKKAANAQLAVTRAREKYDLAERSVRHAAVRAEEAAAAAAAEAGASAATSAAQALALARASATAPAASAVSAAARRRASTAAPQK
jgi:hypothetical protein